VIALLIALAGAPAKAAAKQSGDDDDDLLDLMDDAAK
jgi:hypothetical protein